MDKINLADKFRKINKHYDPKIIAELNGQYMKLVKFKGDFVWHSHENEDESFMVIEGEFTIELRDKAIHLTEGELIVIPKGVEHRPIAKKEVKVLLFEPSSTINTGEADSDFRQVNLDRI
ncbi:MAG: cupin domain-containing protein [Bacteroidetes bacterium]|nr:cupin domain-containing protein [Bacteroidota bacterium]MBT5529578.1 cupin domain-containing protein [Cytophagia bacterium]MBT3802275.1 cupin domain-containing protein [Bacteroidota bacterium]MBT3933305.1 cupin domain-containing protein [Bacteroidota bacterium]MBT4339423.1 cupin domain-containing protein [Bacteroidota bacterium]